MSKNILTDLCDWIKDDNTQEYILISIVRLFDCSDNEMKKKLFDFFKNQKRNSGVYIARSTLEQIDDNLSRGEILELKDYKKN